MSRQYIYFSSDFHFLLFFQFQYEYSQKGGMVTALVRKELCVRLKDLMEHGMVEVRPKTGQGEGGR